MSLLLHKLENSSKTETLNCRDLPVHKYPVIIQRHLVNDLLHFRTSSDNPVTKSIADKLMHCSEQVSESDMSCNYVLAAGISKYLALSQKHYELQVLWSLLQAETLENDILEQEKSEFLCTNVTSNGMFQIQDCFWRIQFCG